MAQTSTIEWTDSTWNPLRGCTRVSEGCRNCYAERVAARFSGPGQAYEGLAEMKDGKARWTGEIMLVESHLLDPIRWKKPRRIFVNSMSDLFHRDVPQEYIGQVFDVMNRADQHRFQVLTKRSDRLLELSDQLPWQAHIWMGVSVESADYTFRIDHLRQTGAHIKFLSLEPLLGALDDLDLTGIDWVIVGGESGHGSREIDRDWVRDIRDQCIRADVSFFFKQWGGFNKKRWGRELDGRTWDQMPTATGLIQVL
jgi:protein gp37